MGGFALTLSGGGFRATLYHLGVVRFLRDAGTLPKITHITSVSGGSILAAHLTLNWDRYNGTDEEFEEAADEIVRLVQMDVRNRIVRRFPFGTCINYLRRLLRMRAKRKFTRAGMLEQHYSNFLYGDRSLFELPSRPRLHVLSTNLSEGSICAFHKDGLSQLRRVPGQRPRLEHIHMGLATVSMAVAASSAFPGFFPPLELERVDVGASESQFYRQSFTDGGVYDNLGLRVINYLEQYWSQEASKLREEDVLEFETIIETLLTANTLPEGVPVRRVAQLLKFSYQADQVNLADPNQLREIKDVTLEGLREIIHQGELYNDPSFNQMELADPAGRSLLNYVKASQREPELNDKLWLNRQLLDLAFSQVIGKPCIRMNDFSFDGVFVSDAGGEFKISQANRSQGLISTALRATDILMDRVWKLELEAAENRAGVIFFSLSGVVDYAHDSTAPHTEIQRQAGRIRTDLDRFSDLEISALIQHGYCVARNVAKANSETFGESIPTTPPWDPFVNTKPKSKKEANQTNPMSDPQAATQLARKLQNSSRRKIWSTLFNLRDYPTYAWLAIIMFVVLFLPYQMNEVYENSQQHALVLNALSETSPDTRRILSLLEKGSSADFPKMPFTEGKDLKPSSFEGFKVISDTRVLDLRDWTTENKTATFYVRLRVQRLPGENNTFLRWQVESRDDELHMVCLQEELRPKIRREKLDNGKYMWEMTLDLGDISIGSAKDVVLEGKVLSDRISGASDMGHYEFPVLADTGLFQIWFLMPDDRYHETFELTSHPLEPGRESEISTVTPNSKVELPFGSLATFQMINPTASTLYHCRWNWKER